MYNYEHISNHWVVYDLMLYRYLAFIWLSFYGQYDNKSWENRKYSRMVLVTSDSYLILTETGVCQRLAILINQSNERIVHKTRLLSS